MSWHSRYKSASNPQMVMRRAGVNNHSCKKCARSPDRDWCAVRRMFAMASATAAR